MNHWWIWLIAVGAAVVLLFFLAPGVFLHLSVRIYPKGHDRQLQFLGDLYDVPALKKPIWVAGALVRCIFEGLPTRFRLVPPDALAEAVERYGLEWAIKSNSGHMSVLKSLRREGGHAHRRHRRLLPYRSYWHGRLVAWATARKLERLRKSRLK